MTKTKLEVRKRYLEDKLLRMNLPDRVRNHVILVEIPQVEAAMLRTEEGTYGLCIDCGEPIGSDRLKAIPEVPHCIMCRPSRGSGKE